MLGKKNNEYYITKTLIEGYLLVPGCYTEIK